MFIITDPPLIYGSKWRTVGVLCSYRIDDAFIKMLDVAKKMSPPCAILESLEARLSTAYIITLYAPGSNIVVAQIETTWQDGCVPPVHTVLVNANPTPTKYHGIN